jgi:hypothetical protein
MGRGSVMTIDQTVILVIVLLLMSGIAGVLIGVIRIRSASRLRYFLLRRERMSAGWRLIGWGVILLIVAGIGTRFGRQAAYVIARPTPSQTPTPTITQTPTITSTPTITPIPSITPTPSITFTPTQTGTPELPPEINILIRETEPADVEPLFSQPVLARRLDEENQPVNPAEDFNNPVETLYAAFTYNNLVDGVRWTAIWYLGTRVICLETQPWDGGTGGYGYTECTPGVWEPGEYEIRMFWGNRWMTSVRFEVIGAPPTVTPVPTSDHTPTVES